MTRLLVLAGLALVVAGLGGGGFVESGHGPVRGETEVIVQLSAPPLAHAGRGGNARLDAEQSAFRRALAAKVPAARVRWRYRLVADGFAVLVPRGQVSELRGLPHVREIDASSRPYAPLDDTQGPAQIGAPTIWGSRLETAGQGIKIGILDTGVDASHPFFSPAGYTMPSGFPKGQRAYTTAKVIVARAFPPPGLTAGFARVAYDPQIATHGTHVAGIAAGDAGVRASGAGVVSGAAPRAYIGNYRVFTRTQSGESPNANAPEIVAGIEAAVRDGMNVINLSLGEFEVDPSRDVVAQALDAAAAAGVVPVVAAGNGYDAEGAGSIWSPANSAQAISVGAVETGGTPATSTHAYFSSVGPTPLSLRLKPDVAAPGMDIVSSLPGDRWGTLSGTSMAAPIVAGAAALLRQRHPSWTVAQIKSALVETGTPARRADGTTALAPPSFVGGGVVSLPAADQPFVFTDPADLSLGYLQPGGGVTGSVHLEDAGGGAGSWQVSLDRLSAPAGAQVLVPSSVQVPGDLGYKVVTSDAGAQGDVSGYIVLARGSDRRHIPFWGRVTAPALGRHRALDLARPGTYRGTTRGQPALVSHYRYPDDPFGLGIPTALDGPERVYRVTIGQGVANFGAVITSEGPETRVQPRLVAGLDENRLGGELALPFVANPYLDSFGDRLPAVGAILPRPGRYAIVFDSSTNAGAGAFTFRFWKNDVTPPSARLRTATVARGRPLRVAVSDRGSGVYPGSLEVTLDGRSVSAALEGGVVMIATSSVARGRHRLELRISDYQETKNDENVPRILPNTRVLHAIVSVR